MKLSRLRRMFRFSIRTLLLVTTVFGIWFGIHVHRTDVQRRSVAAIRDYGGWVRYDFQFPSSEYSYKGFDPNAESRVPRWILDRLGEDFFHSVVQVNLNYSEDSGTRQENDNPSDEALQHLPGLPNIRVLLLSDTQAGDASLRHLARLKKLERLYMWDVNEVSDAGVAHLSNLRNLNYIHLSTSRITDESLQVFGNLPKLRGLSLQFNHFSDDGLEHLAKLTELENLWVCGRRGEGNGITDAGLEYLAGLRNLKELGVQNTQVTVDGLKSFRKAVPNCQIHE